MTACPSCAVPVLPARLLLTASGHVEELPVNLDPARHKPVDALMGCLGTVDGRLLVVPVTTERLTIAVRTHLGSALVRVMHAHRLHVCDRLPEGALWSLDRVADEVTV